MTDYQQMYQNYPDTPVFNPTVGAYVSRHIPEPLRFVSPSPYVPQVQTATKLSTADQLKHDWNGMSIGDKANTIMGTVGTLLNAYNSFKANKLANEQFEHAKRAYNNNWEAQQKTTNRQLEDRQKRRVEEAQANGRTTTSVADYMAKYKI